jgi:hypothetical protein
MQMLVDGPRGAPQRRRDGSWRGIEGNGGPTRSLHHVAAREYGFPGKLQMNNEAILIATACGLARRDRGHQTRHRGQFLSADSIERRYLDIEGHLQIRLSLYW